MKPFTIRHHTALWRRFLALAALAFGISFLMTFWHYWLPKQPFRFLSESRVESVQYCYKQMSGIPYFVPLYPDEQEQFIESLRNIRMGKRTGAKDLEGWSGGSYKPTFLITMKSGFQFYVEVFSAMGPYLLVGLVEDPIPHTKEGTAVSFRVVLSPESYDAWGHCARYKVFCSQKYGF